MISRIATVLGMGLAISCFTLPAHALSVKECSTKYQAAKADGSLGGMSWNEFRKTNCSADAATTQEAQPEKKTKKAANSEAKGLTMKECSAKYQSAKADGSLGGVSWREFRKTHCSAEAVAAEQAQAKKKAKKSDTAKGLTMKECSTKYQAAKADGTLGNVKWNEFRKTECGPDATKVSTKKKDSATGLTLRECSAKYQASKADGSLGGLKWNDFRKAKCGPDAADDETVPAQSEAEYTNDPAPPSGDAPRGVKFPRTISSKFSGEPGGKARMHTCLEGYYANKEANTLKGFKWVQKGGGYYSVCNSRLKGTS